MDYKGRFSSLRGIRKSPDGDAGNAVGAVDNGAPSAAGLRLHALEVAGHGIVVGNLNLIVYAASEGPPMVGAKHVVDAHIDGVAVERAADAVGRGAISVGEVATDAVVGIGDGRVVEVATDNDVGRRFFLDIGNDDIGLGCTLGCRVAQLLYQHLCALTS